MRRKGVWKRVTVAQASEDALALLAQMVSLDPSRRPAAEEALSHQYFRNAPAPTPPAQLPKPPVRAHNPLKLGPKVCSGSLLLVLTLWPRSEGVHVMCWRCQKERAARA